MSDHNLATASNDELIAELRSRHLLPRCPCSKWQTYISSYDIDGYTWRCTGCLRSIHKCTC